MRSFRFTLQDAGRKTGAWRAKKEEAGKGLGNSSQSIAFNYFMHVEARMYREISPAEAHNLLDSGNAVWHYNSNLVQLRV